MILDGQNDAQALQFGRQLTDRTSHLGGRRVVVRRIYDHAQQPAIEDPAEFEHAPQAGRCDPAGAKFHGNSGRQGGASD